jgi:hypothetical protein
VIDEPRSTVDLADPAAQRHLVALAEQMLVAGYDARESSSLAMRVAAKMAASRRFLLGVCDPVEVGVVFAMWGEHNRLRPRSPDNPTGEDSLRMKLDQLEWATRDTPVTWRLYAVDDGDPHDSGRLAAEIVADHPLGDRARVLWLDRALPAADGPLRRLASADDSRKGGAIVHGCEAALDDGVDAVVYTDADNSVHLGQIGLLLGPMLSGRHRVVLGNRKHRDAVLVKEEGRWGIGIALLRHMQRMIGREIFARGILDTQAAFKLYEATLLRDMIADATVFDFSFDTDWILAAIARDEPLATVPFAFIDSAAESASIAQGPMTTWETLLAGLTSAVRKHGVSHDEEMARVLDEEIRDHRDLEVLIDHLPPQLEGVADADLGDPAIMSPAQVQEWIRERKRLG